MTARKRPRWFRYSIRSLLVFVLVLCAFLAYFAHRARRYDDLERQAREIAAKIEYEPSGPKWLREVLGDRHFREPVGLVVYEDFAEACVPMMEEWPSIDSITIYCYDRLDEMSTDVSKRIREAHPQASILVREINHDWLSRNDESYAEKGGAEYSRIMRVLEQHDSQIANSVSEGDPDGVVYLIWRVHIAGCEFEILYINGTITLYLLHDGEVIDKITMPNTNATRFGLTLGIIEDVNDDLVPDIAIRTTGETWGHESIKTLPGINQKVRPIPIYLDAFEITPEGFLPIPLVPVTEEAYFLPVG